MIHNSHTHTYKIHWSVGCVWVCVCVFVCALDPAKQPVLECRINKVQSYIETSRSTKNAERYVTAKYGSNSYQTEKTFLEGKKQPGIRTSKEDEFRIAMTEFVGG